MNRGIVNFLRIMRHKYNLFSIERCAADVGVTSVTVRNFENGKSINPYVLLYYLTSVVRELSRPGQLNAKSNVAIDTINADYQTLFILLNHKMEEE